MRLDPAVNMGTGDGGSLVLGRGGRSSPGEQVEEEKARLVLGLLI